MSAVKTQVTPDVSKLSPEELNPYQSPSLPEDDKHPFPHDISPSVSLVPYFAELICSEGISEKVFALRFDALKMLQGLIHHYDERGYTEKLLNGIAEKKGAMIMSASSKTEMDKILKPKALHFDGVRFIADRYLLPEEELIHRSDEDELLNSLIAWLEGTPWLRTKRDKELYALELHAGRIFDNPDWVDYAAFNRKYRPGKLQGDECSHESGKENP